MSDRDLRELERRAYNSDEDFLRYSTARIRAGLGPVEIKVEQKDLFRPFIRGTIFLVHRRKAWGSILSELDEWRPMWLEHDGDRWVAIYDRGRQAYEENAKAEAQRLALGDLRHRRHNPPGRDDAINAAFKEWQAGDDASLERLMAERARAGLTPTPKHPELKGMIQAAAAAGWVPGGKKRPTVKQAQAALMAWFQQRGWKGDFRATFDPGRGVGGRRGHHLVVISPDEQRRATFLNTTILFEKGGRGNWEKDYAFHSYGLPLPIIEAASRIMMKKAAKPLTREEWTHPMQNPPDKDVVYSLASLAQHGRTSTTLAALVKLTGRTPGQVAAVVRALAERGIVNVRGPLVVFDRRVVSAAVGGPAVSRMANPGSADERMRALQRAARREQETYGVAAEDTEAAKLLQREQERRSVPALGERAYLRDIAAAWGINARNQGSGGWVSVGEASSALRAVFKKAKIKATFKSSSYSGGSHISVSAASDSDAQKMADLFGITVGPAGVYLHRFNQFSVYPNARVDKSDSMTDYFDPGGVTLPQEYFQTYAEALMKAVGSKKATEDKRTAKREAASQARQSAPLVTDVDEVKAPAVGQDYLFDLKGRHYGVWRADRTVMGGPNALTEMYLFQRIGRKGEPLSIMAGDNTMYVSAKQWQHLIQEKAIKHAPRTNPGLAVLGWAGNPGGTLTLIKARKRLKKLLRLGHHTLLNDLVARTRPRDQDKLKAEIAHAFRQKNPKKTSYMPVAQAGVDVGKAKWVVSCDAHGTMVGAKTEADARRVAGHPKNFCDECRRSKNPGSGGRRPLGHQQGGKKKTLTMEQAIAAGVDKAPGFAQALKEYRKFHGADPHSVDVYRYASSKNDTKVMVTMGRVPETQYVVDGGKDSNKAGHHWVHKHREKGKGREPNLLFDPVSGTMQIAGGSFKVTSWIYH